MGVRVRSTGRAGSWICRVCEHSNLPSWKACRTCRCPADATPAQIETLRAEFGDAPFLAEPYQSLRDNYDPKPGDRQRKKKPYACEKCGHQAAHIGEIDLESDRFAYVACQRCGFTEFYYGDMTALRAAAKLLGYLSLFVPFP